MFEKEELQLIGNVLAQITFKAGQSQQVITVEAILNKIQGSIGVPKQETEDEQE